MMPKGTQISVIPQEDEPNGSDSRSHSTDVTQEMESKAGVNTSNPIPMIQQEIEPNSDMMGPDGDEMETNDDDDDTDDIGGNAFPVISEDKESNGDGIGRSSIGETYAADIQSNSMPVIIQEVESNIGDARRNTIASIPQEMEQESGDIRRNSMLVIPVGIEANGADIRRKSIARNIQSRYLRASTGSCHDYCKYGMRKGYEDENLVSSPSAERKRRTPTINSKSSPDTLVTDKRVIPMTKKGTPPKKVSSLLKEVDAAMEDSFVAEKSVVSVTKKGSVSLENEIDVTMEDMDLEEDGEQVEPSVPLGPVRRLPTSKVISTVSPKPSEDSRTKKLNSSGISEKRSLSLAKTETVSSKMASSSFKETDVSTINSKVKPEKPEKSFLSASASSLRNPKVISRGGPKPSKNETSSFKEIGVSVEDQGSSNKGHGGTRKSKEVPDVSSSAGNTSIRNNNRRTSLRGEKRMTGIQTVSLSSKHSSRRDSNISTGNSYNLKGLSHMKDQSDPGKVETQPMSDKDMPEKILYVIESSTENSNVQSTSDGVPKSPASPALPSEGESKSLKYARKGIGRAGSSPSSEKKNLKRVNGARSQSAGPLNQDKKGLRRTHHGTQASLSPSPSSSSMSVASVESTHNEGDGVNSQREIVKSGKPTGNMKAQHKTTPRRSAIDGSGNKNNVSRKLTFRRGRVVELQPENNTPRRLKFRRVRLAVESPTSKGTNTSGSIGKKGVDENQSAFGGFVKRASNLRKAVVDRQSNGATGIKRVSNVRKDVGDRQSNAVVIKRVVSTGKKEVDDGQSNGAKVKSETVGLRNQEHVEVSPRKILRRKPVIVGPLNGLRSNTEKVVLRHRDVNGKKDDRKLFNNVIEETASKLVETRKSKVKALVGAFETVISLQDKRQVASTVDA